MASSDRPSFWSRIAPALTLMVLAPLVAEALQGATRPSVYLSFPAIFLFEVAVWGGAAVMLRYCARRWRLGWLNLLLLSLVIAVAEEFLIQQTSIAPMVIQLQHVEYARAFGVNYVYFVWAAIYESVFVVLVPVMLAELIYPTRRDRPWLSIGGLIPLAVFFIVGSLGAWFSWTQIARTKVFHMAPYSPPPALLLAGVVAIAALFFVAIGPFRRALAKPAKPMPPPPPIVLAALGVIFAVLAEALAALAFGEWPNLSPALALGATFAVVAAAIVLIPAWCAHPDWRPAHRYALTFGAVFGNMFAGYAGYIWATTPIDFWGKTIIDALALIGLVVLGLMIRKRPADYVSQGGIASSFS